MAGGKSSKVKGSSGEREACKMLGEIFEGSFIRSPNSGAYIGGKNAFRKSTLSAGQTATLKGDIVPPDFMPKLVLECKSYAEFRFHQLISPDGNAQLDEWISQCLDVVDATDEWFVIFKITRLGWFVAVPHAQAGAYAFRNYCRYTGRHGMFMVTDFRDFFMINRQEVLRRTAAPHGSPSS